MRVPELELELEFEFNATAELELELVNSSVALPNDQYKAAAGCVDESCSMMSDTT